MLMDSGGNNIGMAESGCFVIQHKNDNTCSLFLIQHDTTGGLPCEKKHVSRAVCPTSTLTCCGGFSKRSAGPARTKQSVLTPSLPAHCGTTVELKA